MRALFFLLILLSAYYIAAAYRFAPLLALCLAEGAVLVLLLLSAVYLRARTRVSLGARSGEAVRGRERACTIRVQNPSRLPAAKLELYLTSRWLWEERGMPLFLYGGAARGDSRMEFHVRAAHCGLLLLRLHRVRVYDCLSLFRASRNIGEELCLAVYPEPIPLRVRLAGSDWEGASRGTDLSGGESGEILKIREYQAGDSLRRVHWNLSARTDTLWMKEFSREADRRVHLLLDMGTWASPWAADAFWQVLYSLSLGLLDAVTVIRFHWLEAEAGRWYDAYSVEAVREFLLLLYRAALPGTVGQRTPGQRKKRRTRRGPIEALPPNGADQAGPPPWTRLLDGIPPADRFLRLTADLCLWAEDGEAVRFTAKGLPNQIRAAALDL